MIGTDRGPALRPPPAAPPPSPRPPKPKLRKRLLTALPFTDNVVSVVAGLLAIATFAAGALGYVAKTERDERNELEGAVASLERQSDDLRETNEELTVENGSLRDENDSLEAQLDDRQDDPTPPTTEEVPDEESGSPTVEGFLQIYPAQDVTLTASCNWENAADLDVPRTGVAGSRWDVDHRGCNSSSGRLVFADYTRHAAGPAGATAEQCADVLRRNGIGPDDEVVPLPDAVWCVQTTTDGSERDERPPRVVRMVVRSVDDGESVVVNVEAWEPD